MLKNIYFIENLWMNFQNEGKIISYLHMQGLTNLIYACTDFCGRKIVLSAPSCMQNYVRLKHSLWAANLHCLIYNVLNDIVFSIYFAIS